MTNQDKIKLAESCGLSFQKIEDDAPQFCGEDKQFKEYQEKLDEEDYNLDK